MPYLELRDVVDELLEKWSDVKESSDDLTEATLADEVIDDLKRIAKCLPKN